MRKIYDSVYPVFCTVENEVVTNIDQIEAFGITARGGGAGGARGGSAPPAPPPLAVIPKASI